MQRGKGQEGNEQKTNHAMVCPFKLLKLELLDHVIIGNGNRSSLRELGYFAV